MKVTILKHIEVVITVILVSIVNSIAAGIFVTAEFDTTSNASARIREFRSGQKVSGGYVFTLKRGNQIEVRKSELRGVMVYPQVGKKLSKTSLTKKINSLQSFMKKFPQSKKYLINYLSILQAKLGRINVRAQVPKLTLKNGKVYYSYKLIEKKVDSVVFLHDAGQSTIPYENLPDSYVKSIGGFDEEKIRWHRLSSEEKRKEKILAKKKKLLEKHKLKQKEEAKLIDSHEKSILDLKRPIKPRNLGTIKRLNGTVISILPDGLLILIDKKSIAVKTNPIHYQMGQIYSGVLEKSLKVYRYTTVLDKEVSVPVWGQPRGEYRDYLNQLRTYSTKISSKRSKIKLIKNRQEQRQKEINQLR